MSDLPPLPFPPLQPARLERTATGVPYSTAYGDVYHSASGAVGQAQHVFLHGNGLPERWQGEERFVILETGFGLGLNFLATWAAWKDDPRRCQRLHFVSVEKHPFRREDLAELHRAFPEFAPLAAQLQAAWPLLVPGPQRLHFEGGRVTLTLYLGDALSFLPQLRVGANAFYLDGFSPAKNPELWSDYLFRALSRLAAKDATLATWSVAGGVRDGLKAVGFVSEKVPGFGTKRQMLRGRYRGPSLGDPGVKGRRVLVIGAGFAGTSVAERLAARNFAVTLVDGADGPGQGASGNRVGVLRHQPSLDDNRLSRLTRAAFLYTRNHLQQLSQEGLPVHWGASGVIHLARDAAHEALQARTVAHQQPPAEYLQYLDREAASARIGWPVDHGGWYFPLGGWGVPPSLCAANLARWEGAITPRYGQRVEQLEYAAGAWRALDPDGRTIAECETVVLANAADAKRLAGAQGWLPLSPARGQATLIPEGQTPPLEMVVCGQGYITPAYEGLRVCGASFLAGDEDEALRLSEQRDNLDKLQTILPGFAPHLTPAQLAGRVGFRPISLDRMPMLGPLPENAPPPANARLVTLPRRPGLWLASGFGARGFVLSALAGEFLASRLAGDPWPLERELGEALDPGRFQLHQQRHPMPEDVDKE